MAQKLGEASVGTIVKMNIDGKPINFRIIQQGLPSSGNYDSSCDGTWVQTQDIYSKQNWGGYVETVYYQNAAVNSWLNNTFVPMFDADIQGVSKQVKIPCEGSYHRVTSVSCKSFLLSATEFGFTSGGQNAFLVLGATLDYFVGGSNQKRIANYNGSPDSHWTRSQDAIVANDALCVNTYGTYEEQLMYDKLGVCPVLILPQSLYIDDNDFVVINQPPTAPASITASNIMGNQQASITLGAASDPDGTVISYVYERSIDTGMWTQFASTASLSVIDQIGDDWDTVRYRAKAVDDKGVEGP